LAYLAIKAATMGSGKPRAIMPCFATSGGISWNRSDLSMTSARSRSWISDSSNAAWM
jgi:hypothetical protein